MRPAHLHKPYYLRLRFTIRLLDDWIGEFECSFAAGCACGRVLVCGRKYRECAYASGFWVGCLGDVDAGCYLVCLVAGLGDWVCVVGVFDVLGRLDVIVYVFSVAKVV